MKFVFLSTLLVLFTTFTVWTQPVFQVADLKTEHLSNPLGLDALHPRFSWRQDDTRTGARQTSYRILVHTDSAALVKEQGTLWDTGWITADQSLVTYKGQVLQPF